MLKNYSKLYIYLTTLRQVVIYLIIRVKNYLIIYNYGTVLCLSAKKFLSHNHIIFSSLFCKFVYHRWKFKSIGQKLFKGRANGQFGLVPWQRFYSLRNCTIENMQLSENTKSLEWRHFILRLKYPSPRKCRFSLPETNEHRTFLFICSMSKS